MAEHQRLEFAVVGAAPECSLQESPADFNFALIAIVLPIPRAADNSPGFQVDNGESPFRLDRAIEEPLKYVPFVSVAFRVLLPDQRIARRGEQRLEVVRP